MQETYLIYILTLFLSAGFAFLGVNYSKQRFQTEFKWNKYYLLSILVLVLTSGFRPENIGTDFHGYLDAYNKLKIKGTLDSPIFKEIGWTYLNIFFANLNINSNLFFSFVALLIWGPFYKSSYKYFYLLPLMLFFIITDGFFFWSLSGLRQSIAITLFMFAIKYIIEQKKYYFIITILIASLFHKSAIILFPLFLIRNAKFNPKIWGIMYIVSIIFMHSDFFLELSVKISNIIIDYLPFFESYKKSYVGDENIRVFTRREATTGLGVALRIITNLIILLYSKDILKKDKSFNIYFILYFVGAIVTTLFFSIEIIGRIANYFIFFKVLIIPMILQQIKFNSIKNITLYLFFILSYFIMFLFSIYNSASKCSPYIIF